MSDTRAKVLAAAVEILTDGTDSTATVRAVAARAGVGVGTLRHHFKTQRELIDAALAALYTDVLPDERIHDATIPAADRLLECVRNLLAPVGDAEQAREFWRQIFRTFIDSDATDAGFLVTVAHTTRRVESWLAVLTAEGALPPGDDRSRGLFLMTVIDGLALGRALPGPMGSAEETVLLRAAVNAVLTQPWPPEAAG